jgi:type I restriction enzyme M protein
VNKNLPFYQELFENVKKELIDDDLFEPNEIIRIRENSFEAIVEELQIYNLSTTSDDVKGIAFEQFLGKTFRGELGQFFTPRTIVDFMVEVLDPQESEVICDPCCGSGGFLIKAFEYVRSKVENDIHLAKEKIKVEYYNDTYEQLTDKKKEVIDETVTKLFTILNTELDINNPMSRIRELSYDCIFGTDANPRMSRTAKMNMIMHGDGHGGVHHNDGLLNVNGIFENRFDIILTNPPFGSRVERSLKITEADKYTDEERIKKYRKRYGSDYDEALKQVNNNIGNSLLDLYKTGSMSTLTEVLFIERCLNLLKPGGRIGIVLPEGVLNNPKLQKIREFVERKAKIILITSIPQDVFIASGATIKPSLLFFKKFTEEESYQWEIISTKAEEEISKKYELQIKSITEKLEQKGKDSKSIEERKKLKKELKQIENKILSEIRTQIKKEFNYQIPIAKVEKAGISTTGSQIENELEPLAKEFSEYRKKNKLWTTYFKEINYLVTNEDIRRIRIYDGVKSEPEIFYSKTK